MDNRTFAGLLSATPAVIGETLAVTVATPAVRNSMSQRLRSARSASGIASSWVPTKWRLPTLISTTRAGSLSNWRLRMLASNQLQCRTVMQT